MSKYRLTLAYDGTHYSGWQVQPNSVTIQETLQEVLQKILQEKVWVTGSGRTDAGVHALAQVAHFSTEKQVDLDKLFASLNCLLPVDIRILDLEKAPDDFHARYSAKGKTYRYHLTIETRDPFHRFYSTYFPYHLDLELMKQASKLFIGTHDFTTFANEASAGAAAKNPVRTIKSLEMIIEEHGVCFEFIGDGFLYKMVRNIMGTLIEVGSKKLKIEDIDKLFKAKDRRKAGKTAPPQGLFLVKVDY